MKWTIDKSAQILFIGGVSWFFGCVLGCVGLVNGWVAFLTFWLLGSLFYLALAMQTVSPIGKAVLVTGCDTGFGYTLALHLDSLGYRVFAGCLFADKCGEGATALKETGSKRLHVIQLNVTSETEVKSAREMVNQLLPSDECLWAIVNNAGLSTFGKLEWVPITTFKKIADVNLYGTISVTKEFLPLIRRSKGRVINVASMLGRMGASMRSPYVATKFAVEGVSDCLRFEMKEYGVDVIVIEPGNFIAGTAIFSPEAIAKQGDDMWQSMSNEARSIIGEENFRRQIEIMKTYITAGGTDITPVITAFEEAVTQKYPQARYQPTDLYYKARIFSATHLPEWLFDLIYFAYLNK